MASGLVSVRADALRPGRPCVLGGPRGYEPSHFRPSGAAFSREPGLCDAHFIPVSMQEAKPYMNEKENVCVLCAALSNREVPARRVAASPLSKALGEQKSVRNGRDQAAGLGSRWRLSRPEEEGLEETAS